MAGTFTQVDLSRLPAPAVVEPLNFEAILSAMVSDLVKREPTYTALLESDPAFKILEVCAYRELLLRKRVNDACRSIMLAYAAGADLDQLAANYGIARLLVSPAGDTTIPPTPAVFEDDASLRARVTLSLEAYTSAGSQGSYVFNALSASGDVKDVSATSPTPGRVVVYVLSRRGAGAASPDLIAAVKAALNAERVRPMTDQVTVLSASIVNYTISAELVVYPGPDRAVVLAAAQAAVSAYAKAQHRMGYDITLSGIYSALHQPGVQRVNLAAPAANITVADGEAAFCTGITLTVASAPDV